MGLRWLNLIEQPMQIVTTVMVKMKKIVIVIIETKGYK